jgi:hypothetical protein
MIAMALVALVAAPAVAALWVLAWLVGDLFAGPVRAHIPIRFKDDWGR